MNYGSSPCVFPTSVTLGHWQQSLRVLYGFGFIVQSESLYDVYVQVQNAAVGSQLVWF